MIGQTTLLRHIWRSVEDSNLCDVAAGLGLAIRPLTYSGNAPYGNGFKVSVPTMWRRLKDSNSQDPKAYGFLDRSATNYGISRRMRNGGTRTRIKGV